MPKVAEVGFRAGQPGSDVLLITTAPYALVFVSGTGVQTKTHILRGKVAINRNNPHRELSLLL